MDLRRTLGVELPVIQAPMAGAHGSALAIAVHGAGALGSLPCAMLEPAAVRRDVAAVRAAGATSFNLNFFCHRPPLPDAGREAAWRSALAPYYRELGIDIAAVPAGAGRFPFDAAGAALIEELRPPVVSFHFGLPDAAFVERVHASGALIFASATTVDEALWLERNGADAVIAQGFEAGGHRGHFLADDLSLQSGTFALLPQVVRAVRVPVIAAGGIADHAGVEAAFKLGASMVQVGTAYLCCPEATISAIHRQALLSDAARHTALTRLITGRPARGIVNRLMREVDDASAPAFPLATAAIAPLRAAAEARGSGDFSPLWCGQNASGCKAVAAAEVTRALAGV
ncbi:MAG TPA: nitronate monooxygenase [Caldimonas sp.]|jgi:nitronate monooxygenase|nr:nitronate monooxygenase [Caldimonas sp.]HEX4233282.1 nitronate monooxygenase [Caldimonas sp.]